MKFHIYSYRFAQEILQHTKHSTAWEELTSAFRKAPIFIFPGKSQKNKKLDVVQKVMNTYFDRIFAVDLHWSYHPFATRIKNSNLRADFRKDFEGLSVQTEIQFGNMARWYSDIFKFQAAYSEQLIQVGVSVLPVSSFARRIDSNVAYFERAVRELPSARLSITLPILLVGLEVDKRTNVIDVSTTRFDDVSQINGKGYSENRWRIVNAYLNHIPMTKVGPKSEIGPNPGVDEIVEEDETE